MPDTLALFNDAASGLGSLGASLSSGSFTVTATGFTAGVTGTATWQRCGSLVAVTLPDLTGTSNAVTMTLTGFPALLTPTRTVWCLARVMNNGVDATGLVKITTATLTLDVYATVAAAAFVAALTKTLYGTTFWYPIG